MHQNSMFVPSSVEQFVATALKLCELASALFAVGAAVLAVADVELAIVTNRAVMVMAGMFLLCRFSLTGLVMSWMRRSGLNLSTREILFGFAITTVVAVVWFAVAGALYYFVGPQTYRLFAILVGGAVVLTFFTTEYSFESPGFAISG